MTKCNVLAVFALVISMTACSGQTKMDDLAALRAEMTSALPIGSSVDDVSRWLDQRKIDHSGLQAAASSGGGKFILAMMPNPKGGDPNHPIAVTFTFDADGKLTGRVAEVAKAPL